MSETILVTGGMRSGKSSFGESFLEAHEDVLYLATALATDSEMERRIKVHQEQRNPHWQTYEGYQNLSSVIQTSHCSWVILECVTTMITNYLFEQFSCEEAMTKEQQQQIEALILNEYDQMFQICVEQSKGLMLITNEVGWGLVSEYPLGRIFTDMTGRINRYLASRCHEVYLVACGLPVKLK